MAYQRIPLTTDPNQTFQCTLAIDGQNKTLSFFLAYNEIATCWTMNITDPATGTMLLASIPLVPGDYPAANILEQYAYLGIGSAYVLSTGNAATEYPDADNLGSEWVLIWSDTP
ncbi:hypothetical protein SOV_04830 [Sporomusa ovata DSM 2662]|uniref:Cyanophage baseplate Pam3 plug gp18 domain-containing protein n=1 Tax=Sporomusa ovata TaxID=2378 RepID=A0A0U1KW92_9FIRM|nr:hypothetical protein [Sporomusa ovata]EQB28153.1 hypothetical protein SOV_2c10760 [Sporomusa ovata DSM 2662]CQR71687.1 hypothetical protein SpAn4DRAFT_3553 [Sporomusa ovata]